MRNRIESLKLSAEEAICKAASLKELDELRVGILGKKGELTEIMKGMRELSKEERPVMGQLANEVRDSITEALEKKMIEVKEKKSRKEYLLKT